MRILAGLLLIVVSGLCASLHAYEQGDFAPRGTLLYSRVADLSDGVRRLAGDEWKTQAERMLLARNMRDFEESEPLINEIRKFVDYLGTTEFIIGDVMIREPYIQSATVVQLKEGAPTKFSEEFRNWVKDNDRDAEIKEDSIGFEGVRIWLKANLLIITTGGMMDVHVQDVIDGFTDESLSKVERFTKWSSKAKGDVVLFADMKAWRAALDRLGEDFSDDFRRVLEVVEWQKWELITGTATLPGKTSSLSIDLTLSLNQPFERVDAFLKPSGGSRLVNMLPSECVGFVTAQLGSDHQATYNDLVGFFHDFEQDQRPANLKRRIAWREDDLKRDEERLARLKEKLKERDADKDKDAEGDAAPQNAPSRPVTRPPRPATNSGDGGSEEEGDAEEYTLEMQIADTEDEIRRATSQLTELRAELDNHKYQPFQPDKQARKQRGTESERFHDEISEVLGELGFTREEGLASIGNEALMGILNLPDPGFADNDIDDAYRDMWFVLVETSEGWPAVKEKLLDRVLARNLPEDMPEERREEFKRRAEELVFKKVEGGEILRPTGLHVDFCAFGGEGFVGAAANEDVALRILKSSIGQGRLGASNIPGGTVSGSKFAWVNLGAVLGKIARGDVMRDRMWMNFPDPYFDLEKHLPAGFHIALASDESSHALSFTGRTAGEGNGAGAMKMFADAVERNLAYRHDRELLNELERAISAWKIDSGKAMKELAETDRARFIKAVTPQSLLEQNHYTSADGLRSAFDPALADRFHAMLQAHVRVMGPAKDKPDDLSEAGYEWLGLPPDLRYSDERGWHREGEKTPWLVCQMKGDWALDGRMGILWSGNDPRVVWISADDLARLRDATTRGVAWTAADMTDAKPPVWRARRLLAHKSYEMQNLYSRIYIARAAAKAEGKEFKLDFRGSDGDDAAARLRELLGVTEEEWFEFADAGDLTLKTDDAGKVSARFEKWGQWLEVTEVEPESEFDMPYTIKTSMDEE